MRHTIDANWQLEDLGNVHDIVVAIRYEYDANGNLVREEHGGDNFFQADNVTNYTYDANGNLTRVEIVDNARLQSVETRQYDDRGNLLRREIDGVDDRLPDNISDSVQTWQYNEAGHLVQKARDENGDGLFEDRTSYRYEATGWGHLFSGVDMYGHDYAPPQNPKTEFDRE
jgi:YD repeat-containing protein